MYTILLFIVGFSLFVFVFFRVYPPFGGRAVRHLRSRAPQLARYSGGRFKNQIPTSMSMGLKTTLSVIRDYLRHDPKRRPAKLLTPKRFDHAGTHQPERADITWFGHSAFLLRAHGKVVLLDPMLGTAASPFPAFGPKRFSSSLPMHPEDLPHIDAVIISHDHYDHLDYPTVKKLRGKVDMFYVPLGIGAHLEKWGIAAANITELNWWESATLNELTFTCTPARHFSGRTLTDRFATLWSSWVIETSKHKIFFSGDGGYGPHFKEIGERFGSFDLTLLECGQYDTRWPNVHMQPEETVAAHQDLNGKRMLPIHWGAFVLALHDWTEPVERALTEARKQKVKVTTPHIGETVAIGGKSYPETAWWQAL